MQHIVNLEAAIHKDGKWLLVRRGEGEEHESGVLSLVGGKVDDLSITDNLFEETLKREVKEEVGLSIKDIQYIYSTHFMSSRSVVDVIFVCEFESGEIQITQPEEVAEAVWMTLDEIENEKNIKDWTKMYIQKACKAL